MHMTSHMKRLSGWCLGGPQACGFVPVVLKRVSSLYMDVFTDLEALRSL